MTQLVVDYKLLAEVEQLRQEDIHDVVGVTYCYETVASLRNKPCAWRDEQPPEKLKEWETKFALCERQLRMFVAHRRQGKMITMREVRKLTKEIE